MDEQEQEAIGRSPNPADELQEALKKLAPEVFSEGKVDVKALKRSLGEEQVVDGGERYRLDWAGKGDAYKLLQTPTTATLRPQREQSVNFDDAEHAFIEGENLESLKALQKAYFGKVRLIYIDPPYNTGNDAFVYPDRFQEDKEDYLRRVNDLDGDGTLRREGAFQKNTKESGHYHSSWLSMMLPRLYIARNLLREDGAIFVSCDDHEVHNLRSLMNEIFGEENFVSTVIWQKVYSPKNSARHFSVDHDYILVFAKSSESWQPTQLPRTEEQEAHYSNPDNDPRGPWRADGMSARNYYSKGDYPVTTPSGRVIEGPPSGRYWVYSEEKFKELDADGRIWWGESGDNQPAVKRFRSEVSGGRVPQTLWGYDEVGHTQESKKELLKLVEFPNSDAVFETPKPTRLIRRMLQIGTSAEEPDITLDFFAGTGTMLEAVLRQNAEDGGRRRCINIQFPEPMDAPESEVNDIADVARVRIKRVIEDLEGKAQQSLDSNRSPGFRAFRLAPSNFKQWHGDAIASAEELEEQIRLFADSTKDGAAVEDMLYELLLKFGQELTTPVETLEVAGERVFTVDGGGLLFVLDGFSEAMIPPLVERAPREIIALDTLFTGNDQLKSNLELQCRDAGIRLVTV